MIRDIGDSVANNGGVLPGDAYQAVRSRLDRFARASYSRDPQLAQALGDIRNALDDAMERSISPTDKIAWQEARRQYKNALVIERAATGGGEKAAEGIITPAQLRAATVAQNRRAYARGKTDLGELARAGVALMTPLPNSGTASRLAAQGVSHAATSAAGAAIGGATGGKEGAGAGALAGLAAPRLAARAALSRAGQRYLANQLAAGADRALATGSNLLAQPGRDIALHGHLDRSKLCGRSIAPSNISNITTAL